MSTSRLKLYISPSPGKPLLCTLMPNADLLSINVGHDNGVIRGRLAAGIAILRVLSVTFLARRYL